MAKTIFEEMGGTYTQQGDYFIPNLALPEEDQKSIGVWGQRHRRFLKENHKVLYMNFLTSGKLNSHLAKIDEQAQEMFSRLVKQLAEKEGVTEKLNSHLAKIDEQAQEMFSRLVKQLAEKEGVTEKLKADDQMEWVGRMNNIRNRATEVVNSELIYTA